MTQNDQAVHVLDAPAAVDKLVGEKIEQLGMARAVAVETKVVGGSHDSLAEVILPNAIDHHSGCQRMFRAGNPVRELRTRSAGVWRQPRRAFRQQHAQHSDAYRLALRVPIAALEHVDLRAFLVNVLDAANRWQGLGKRGLQARHFVIHGFPLIFRKFLGFFLQLLDLLVDLVGRRLPLCLLLLAGKDNVVLLRCRQKRLQAVVVLLTNRIEHVIVTSCASDRERKEGRPDNVGPLRQHFIAAAGDFLIAGIAPNRPQAVQAGRDLIFVTIGIDFVPGQLFANELIVGLVVVERLNHVVAEAPGAGQMTVILVSL